MTTMQNWLKRRPRPAMVRLTMDSGDMREMPTDKVRSWAVVANSIHALDPKLVEACDPNGGIIRILGPEQLGHVEPDDNDDDGDGEPRAAAPAATPRIMPTDPESQRFVLVAQLLAEANGRVADAYKHSTEVAFKRMIDLFESVNSRSENREKELDAMYKLMRRALQEQLDAEPAATAQDPGDAMLNGMISNFVAGQNSAPTNGKGHA